MNGSASLEKRLIASLEEQARTVDVTFASAGRDLGEGLTLFDALKQGLDALSRQLSGAEITEAGATFRGLAADLRPLRESLATETHALLEIASQSANAGRTLDKLVEHIRLITILARSARIESISIQGVGRDFGDFANEIVELTTQAQRTIETCARDHARMSNLLHAALSSQREFESRYGAALWALADKLGVTIAEVENRQRRGIELASEAAERSGKIALAAGMAIVTLQSGDSVRQRLEHAIAGLRLAATLEEGAPAELAPEEAQIAHLLLLLVESAQLEASAQTLAQDTRDIERNLLVLRNDTTGLLDLVRSLYGTDSAQSGSFMAEIGTDLGQASALLGKCNTARAGVDQVAKALGSLLDVCQQTVDALATTVSNIVLIGTNAGLRAARVGSNGRSLVVIAQELKFAADLVARDSRTLPDTFALMQKASLELKREDRLDAGHFDGFEREMGAALATMQSVASRLEAELDRLTREGGAFGHALDQARLGFSAVGASAEVVAGAAHAVAGQTGGARPPQNASAQRAREWVTDKIRRHYTMAAERTIHDSIVGATGSAAPAAAEVSEPAPQDDDIDALLF
ncbi:hypothetical protein [Bosea sp. (in: a-proteobacteria)]|uniref:hypothetical protein n=1 Tax=Bosea sp. (in: a-proteobacteria) TaxID=1871050 RepID=UPI003B3B0D99